MLPSIREMTDRLKAFEMFGYRKLLRINWTARRTNASIISDLNTKWSFINEIKRRKLGLPRAKFKFNIFRKEEKKDFVFKYLRFKKRKIKILSREIWLPVPYQKELII